jgi:integrase
MAVYERVLDGPKPAIGSARSKPGSLSAAIVGYYTSLHFRSLAARTQQTRRATLERFREQHGDKPIALLPAKFISDILSTMKPFAARNWLKAIRHLIGFCVEQELCSTDPTLTIKLPRAKSDGYHTWTEGEIELFEAHHPIGSRARLAFGLLLYTGQRRGDVIRMGRQHIRDGVLSVKQEKTGAQLAIPVHPELKAILDAVPHDQLTFIISKHGKPFHPTSFSIWFRSQCDAAGLPNHCSAHGLRKAACRRLAHAGCSANVIMSISGHTTMREIERYTKAAD